MIRTVLGNIATSHGMILTHEHLQIDLSAQKSADVVIGPEDEADIIADLRVAMTHGLGLLVDLTVPGSGRDASALARISTETDLNVVAATGFYWDPFPEIVQTGSIRQLADIMIDEIREGIGGRNIACGVIKIGTPRGVPDETAGRLFSAAAIAARATGAAVVTHTSSLDQVDWHIATLQNAGLPPEQTLISHFGKASVDQILAAGRAGVFLGIDQIGFARGPSYDDLARLVADVCAAGLEQQLILSSDMARRGRLGRYGGSSYSTVFTEFIPRLQTLGINKQQIATMMRDNPLRLLEIRPAMTGHTATIAS